MTTRSYSVSSVAISWTVRIIDQFLHSPQVSFLGCQMQRRYIKLCEKEGEMTMSYQNDQV